MAMIAAEAGVSTPTVFNYFGSRDELHLAIIFQGQEEAVNDCRAHKQLRSESLADDLCELLTGFTERSLEICNKPVWRYADSTAIRFPQSEFVKRYSQIDGVLTKTIEEVLVAHAVMPRRGGGFDPAILASILYNHWKGHYLAYIQDDEMTREAHFDRLLPQIRHILDLIFADA